MSRCNLYRKARPRKQGGEFAFCVRDMDEDQLRAYGLVIKGRPVWAMLWWVSATDCLNKKQ